MFELSSAIPRDFCTVLQSRSQEIYVIAHRWTVQPLDVVLSIT